MPKSRVRQGEKSPLRRKHFQAGSRLEMPAATNAERIEAEQHLRSSGSTRQRVTEPAIATEVARRRILRGEYGEVSKSNSWVSAAGEDLGLSSRQRQQLRMQLADAIMPVRTLDSFFRSADVSGAACQSGAQVSEAAAEGGDSAPAPAPAGAGADGATKRKRVRFREGSEVEQEEQEKRAQKRARKRARNLHFHSSRIIPVREVRCMRKVEAWRGGCGGWRHRCRRRPALSTAATPATPAPATPATPATAATTTAVTPATPARATPARAAAAMAAAKANADGA